jgi:hypothetical protein
MHQILGHYLRSISLILCMREMYVFLSLQQPAQYILGVSAIGSSRLLRHPWKKGRNAFLFFCPYHVKE